MVSPWLLLIPGTAAVYAATRPASVPAPSVPRPEIAPGVIDNAKTRGYAALEQQKQLYEARAQGMATAAVVPRSVLTTILSESELPKPSPGYRWFDFKGYWQYGPIPPLGTLVPTQPVGALMLPQGFPTFWKVAAGTPPAAPAGYYWSRGWVHYELKPQMAMPIPENPKTIAYRNAERLKQYVEVRATTPGGVFTMEIPPFVYRKDISESELPKPSPGFRWVPGELPTSAGAFAAMVGLWHYVR